MRWPWKQGGKEFLDGMLDAVAGRKDWEGHLGEQFRDRCTRKLRSGDCHGLARRARKGAPEETMGTKFKTRDLDWVLEWRSDQRPKVSSRENTKREAWESGLGGSLGRVCQDCAQSMHIKLFTKQAH